jgi:hypothetical protein
MRIELLPGLTNVVRFPIERRARPTLQVLRDIAPDVRELMSIAHAFGLAGPVSDLRDRTDAETAEHILNHVPETGERRRAALDALLEPVVARAIDACRAAHDLSVETTYAHQAMVRAQMYWRPGVAPLQQRAETLTLKTVELLVEAHARVEAAEGVARAVGIAQRGETWTPRDVRADEKALFGLAG